MADDAKDAGAGFGTDILVTYFAADRKRQLDVAVALEDLADALPGQVERPTLCRLLDVVAPSWAAHRALQEGLLFPLIVRRHGGHEPTLAQLDLLHVEHRQIEGCNDEVIEQLNLSLEGARPHPEMLGYLLRNAFEARRRHIEWEGAVVTKLLPKVLAPVERDLLQEWIAGQLAR